MTQSLTKKYYIMRSYAFYGLLLLGVALYLHNTEVIETDLLIISGVLYLTGFLVINNHEWKGDEKLIFKPKYLRKDEIKHKEEFKINSIIRTKKKN